MLLKDEFVNRYYKMEQFDLMALFMQEISEKHIQDPVGVIEGYIDQVYEDPPKEKYKELKSDIHKEIEKRRKLRKIEFDEVKQIIFEKLIDFEEPADDDPDDARSICMYLAMLEIDN